MGCICVNISFVSPPSNIEQTEILVGANSRLTEPDISVRLRRGTQDVCGTYRVLVGKPEGKRPLGRPRLRWVDNIRMDLQKVGCGYMDWIGLAQDRDRWRTLVSAVMNLRVP